MILEILLTVSIAGGGVMYVAIADGLGLYD